MKRCVAEGIERNKSAKKSRENERESNPQKMNRIGNRTSI